MQTQANTANWSARAVSVLSDLGRDVRYAVRQIRRSPGFAALAVLCLGLGIGVNTAIFGVINSLLIRPMSVTNPDQLVMVNRGEGTSWSYLDYRDLQTRSVTLAGLTVTLAMESDLDVDGESEFVTAEVVPANYPDVLGITMSQGRWFVDDAEPAVVISHAVWERQFALSPDVLGRRIQSQSQSFTIVGVAPRAFVGVVAPMRTDLWVPIRARPIVAAQLQDRDRRSRLMMIFGRLRAGATAMEASAELNAIDAQLVAEHGRSADIQPPIVAEHVRGIPDPGLRLRAKALTVLLGIVVTLVLLIACVNVGNLLLVRGAQRRREFGVRRALGASRFRLVQQLLVESLVLAAAGGVCGVVLAVWTNRLLERSMPPLLQTFPIQVDLSIDLNGILFGTAAALVATILCGWLPGWRASRANALLAFKNEIGGGARRKRPFGVVSQVVMSLVLLFLAGSVVRGLVRLQTMDPGFDVNRRLYAHTFLSSTPGTLESSREFYSGAVERLRALPGVRTAALTSSLPLTMVGGSCVSRPGGPKIPVTTSAVETGYFGTMGIGMIAGRDFTAAERTTAPAAVVLNEALARRVSPEGLPVGQELLIGCDAAEPAVVVGLVKNSAIRAIGEVPQPHLYRPFASQHAGALTAIVVEASTDPVAMVSVVRRALLDLGRGIRVYDVQPLATHIEQRFAPFRWLAAVLTTFGLLALVLAAIGLYGVIAYWVTLRTQEIGVRMALGANRRDIFREVLTHGFAIVVVGVVIGEFLTGALTIVIASRQVGVVAAGLWTHVAISVIWIAVACAASYLPAARASRVDPVVALRYE